jgi:hypothetical protein
MFRTPTHLDQAARPVVASCAGAWRPVVPVVDHAMDAVDRVPQALAGSKRNRFATAVVSADAIHAITRRGAPPP